MKNLLLFTLVLSGVGTAISQDTETVNANHQLGISFHQPFRIDEPQSAGILPPDIIVVFNGSDLKGSRYGVGLDYKFNFKNSKDFCFLKVGLTQNNRRDLAEQEYANIYNYENYRATLDMDLKKTQFNFGLGYGRNFPLANRFSIDIGFSIVGIFDLKNELKYNVTENYNYANNQTRTEMNFHYYEEFVKWKHIGLSPLIRPIFNITKHLSLSAEAQLMGLISFTNKKGVYEQQYRYREYDANQEYYNYEEDLEIETSFKGTFLSLSKISPTLRIAYSF